MKPRLNCVLVIDDDEPTNFLSNIVLEECNCANHIQIIQSGNKALDYLSKTSNGSDEATSSPYPELIFLDINMPAMNGWEFLERFKHLPKGSPNKPVIIMLTTSIHPDDQFKASCTPLIAGFENKPLTCNMVETLLEKYF